MQGLTNNLWLRHVQVGFTEASMVSDVWECRYLKSSDTRKIFTVTFLRLSNIHSFFVREEKGDR